MSTPWLTVSLAFLNKKEVPGPSANPEIIEMYRLCGHKVLTTLIASFGGMGLLAKIDRAIKALSIVATDDSRQAPVQ